MMRSRLVVAAASMMAALGCNKTPEQDVTKAVEAQHEANQEISEAQKQGAEKIKAAQDDAIKAQNEAQQARAQAQREATEKAGAAQTEATRAIREGQRDNVDAQREAHEKVVEAQNETTKAKNEVVKKSAEAQAEANKTIRAANEDVTKARNDLREWSQKEINEIDSAIDAARVKTADTSAAKKADFVRSMRDVQAKRVEVGKELATLDTQPTLGLSKFETRVRTHVDALKTRVDKMRNEL